MRYNIESNNFSFCNEGERASQVAVVMNPPANAGDTVLIPRLGRYLGIGNGNPLQYSCVENPMDREAWWATDHAVTKELDTT